MALIMKRQVVLFDSVLEINDVVLLDSKEKEMNLANDWGVYVPDEFIVMLYSGENTK